MSSRRAIGPELLGALALVVAACLAEGVALAEPSPSDVVTAKNAMRDGRAARDAGRWDDAAKAFRAAFALVPTPNTGSQLAQALVASGHLVEAREVAFAVVKMPVVPNEPAEHADGRGSAMVLARELDRRIPTLIVEMTGLAVGVDAEISLDGVPVKRATLGVARSIDPGKHTLVATAPGYADVKREFTAAEQQKLTETLAMASATAAPPASATAVATAPCAVAPASVTVPPPSPSGWRTVGIATASVGAASLVAGGAFGLLAMSKWAAAKDSCGASCASDSIAHTQAAVAATYGYASTVALVAGGALAAAGVSITLLASTGSKRSAAFDVVPGGVQLQGRF